MLKKVLYILFIFTILLSLFNFGYTSELLMNLTTTNSTMDNSDISSLNNTNEKEALNTVTGGSTYSPSYTTTSYENSSELSISDIINIILISIGIVIILLGIAILIKLEQIRKR